MGGDTWFPPEVAPPPPTPPRTTLRCADALSLSAVRQDPACSEHSVLFIIADDIFRLSGALTLSQPEALCLFKTVDPV